MDKIYTERMRWHGIIDRLPKDRPIVAAEIGVWQGGCSYQLLKALPNLFLYMVDRWQAPQPGDSYYQSGSLMAEKPQTVYDEVYKKAVNRTELYRDRRYIINGCSYAPETVNQIADGSLDLCFIDADHSYDGVRRDIIAWKNKVKVGGWLCGHDYGHPVHIGVKQAVDELLGDYVIEFDAGRTWFCLM